MPDDSELVERAARAMAKANGDDFDNIAVDKSDWTEHRGEFGGHFRDVNALRQTDYLDMARAAIAEVQRWRPIETAEGDPVLLGFPRNLHALVGHLEGDKWGWLDDEMGFHPFVTQPIGWMPLPAPPQI